MADDLRYRRVLLKVSGEAFSDGGDATIAVRLRMREEAVVAARDDLVIHDLVAYQSPLTQVLSLPTPRVERSGPAALRALLHAEEDSGLARSMRRE